MARTALDTIKLFQMAKEGRVTFDNHWQEVADLYLPTREFTTKEEPGEQKRRFIYNETPANAVESLAAALHGMLTNPAIRWLELAFEDFDDTHDPVGKAWLYDTTSRMLAYFSSADSGFTTASHELYLDLVSFGNAVIRMFVKRGMLRFQARELANFYWVEDDDGDITDTFRVFCMKAREIIQKFGSATPGPSDKIRDLAKEPATAERKFTLVHSVYRRNDRDPTMIDNLNMPWGSQYVEHQGKHLIAEGGFLETPYMTPRWSKAPQETYGRGPAMTVLPGTKTLNAMERDQLIAGEQRVRPPINVFANSMEGPINTAPGSINYMRPGTREFPTPMNLGTDPRMAEALIEKREAKIERAFFLDILRLPDTDRMTAEEVRTRRQQGLLQASPVVSRVVAEWLDPAVVRVFNWMLNTGQFLPPPAHMQGRPLRVLYTGPMAQSQRASEAGNVIDALTASSLVTQADPIALISNIDTDLTFRLIWNQLNADPRVLRTPKEAARIRQALQQQQEIAAQATTAKDFAAAGRDAAAATQGAL